MRPLSLLGGIHVRLTSPWLVSPSVLVAFAILGPTIGAASRPLFVISCLVVGIIAWQQSPAAHFTAATLLFCFTPLVRRLVDVELGFDQSGLMIAGPLAALLAPLSELAGIADPDRPADPKTSKFLLLACCTIYTVLLSVAQGQWSLAAGGALKWLVPLAYGLALYERRPDAAEFLDNAAKTFRIILPIIAVYGVYQYVNPPIWDRYWLEYAPIASAGLPAPYQVRVFSTMHAPAAFATFTAIGIVMLHLTRSDWTSRLAIVLAAVGLLLSMYRTAWLSLAAGLVFGVFWNASWRATAGTLIALAMGGLGLSAFSPHGDLVAARLGSLGDLSNDSSGNERLAQFSQLWSQPDGGLLGSGFGSVDVVVAGAQPVDGMIIACWSAMGLVVGLAYLLALVSLILDSIRAGLGTERPSSLTFSALSLGWLLQVPLATITTGEHGFLFWALTGCALAESNRGRSP
jgi:hypothetical protein